MRQEEGRHALSCATLDPTLRLWKSWRGKDYEKNGCYHQLKANLFPNSMEKEGSWWRIPVAVCILAICVGCFLYLCICVPSKIGGIRREWRNRCCRQAEAFLISWADLQTCLLYLYLYLSLYLQTDNSTPDQFSIFANMPVLPTKKLGRILSMQKRAGELL